MVSIAVLPFGRTVEAITVSMAVLSLFGIYLNCKVLSHDVAIRCFAWAFGLMWLATVCALPDAVNVERSAVTSLGYVRFGLAGLLVALYVRRPQNHLWIARVTTWLLVIWSLDIYIQAVFGTDIFGYTAQTYRLNGMFGDGGPKCAIVTALLLPFAIEYLCESRPWPLAAVLLAVICGAIVLSGTRTAWVTLCVVALIYGWIAWRRFGRQILVPATALAATAVLALGLAYQFSDRINARVHSALVLFESGGREAQHAADNALSHRYWIWRASANMIQSNPLNGVGPRGFRYAFAEHAEPGDPYFERPDPIIPTHSHHYVLELLTESGVIGLVLFLAAVGVLSAFVLKAMRTGNRIIRPYAVCLVAGLFPFNTHLAFYSSFWSQLMWWLVALLIAAGATVHDSGSANRPAR